MFDEVADAERFGKGIDNIIVGVDVDDVDDALMLIFE